MHGTKNSEKLPIYGNKVIAVRNGHIEMHGAVRNPVWTHLYESVAVDSDTMVVMYDTSFDWKVGDRVVLAPTDFDFTESEEVTITEAPTVDSANKRATVKFTP